METGGRRNTSAKRLLPVALEHRILEQHAFRVRKNQRQPQIQRRAVENRKLPRPAVAQVAHHRHQRGESFNDCPLFCARNSDISQVACPSITASRAVAPSSLFRPWLDKFRQVEVLVGQRVRKLVGQHRLLRVRWGRFGDEQLLLVVIVEGRRLLGQKFHGVLRQVEILRRQAEFLERQFLGPDLLRLGNLLHPLVQEFVDFSLAMKSQGTGWLSSRPEICVNSLGDPVGLAAQRLRLAVALASARPA